MNLQKNSVELLFHLAAGELTEEQLKDYKYLNLLELKELAAQMPISSEAYVALRQWLFTLIAHHLVGLHRKIVVGIMGVESSVWIGDELYHLLDRSETFVPYVFSLRARTQPKEEPVNQKTYEAFNQNIRQKGMRLVENFDSEAQREYTWDELPVHPDICIWLLPWMFLFQGDLRVWNFPLTTLHTLIPYGYPCTSDTEHTFDATYYNQQLHNLAWLIFLE